MNRPDGLRLISEWVGGALRDFHARDQNLLSYRVSEWSCAFRIAVYLERRIDPAWDVDSEYDRQGVNGRQKNRDPASTGNMRPDIVIHRRGSLVIQDNLLLLEIKKLWVPGGNREDLEKVRAAVSGKLDFQYQFAAAIGLCISDVSEESFDPRWTLFAAGESVLFEDQPVLRTMSYVASEVVA